MAFSLRGVNVPHRKNTDNTPVARIETPKSVTIPMSMHIGVYARPTVSVGDTVKIGTRIGEAEGKVSSPIYSSISGKVTKIHDYMLPGGSVTVAVDIESDGEMTAEDITPPIVDSHESLIEAIQKSGIVGLGGAGFPTHFKLDVKPEQIEHLIINGAECEPYVTSDTYTMVERRDDMKCAIEVLKKYLKIKNIIIGIESNKPKAIKSMKQLASETSDECDVRVKVLRPLYPQGGEKVLIHHTTGKVVPVGKLPIDVGCVVINCTTLAAIGTYLKTGMPLIEKCVTVDGGAIKNPQNVIAPIGTTIEDLFEFCGGLTEEPAKVIYGGPMMGITLPNLDYPVIKNTNAVLALTEKEAKLPKTTACIRCGSCTNTCPFGLAPAAIMKAFKKKDADALAELNVNACMECGCCSFVCPANRPLVQTNKMAKIFLKETLAKEAQK